MAEKQGPLHFPRESFVANRIGTLKWKFQGSGTKYQILFEDEDKENLERFDKAVPSLENIEKLLTEMHDEILEKIGDEEKTKWFKHDLLIKCKSLHSARPSHLSELN